MLKCLNVFRYRSYLFFFLASCIKTGGERCARDRLTDRENGIGLYIPTNEQEVVVSSCARTTAFSEGGCFIIGAQP